MLMAFLRLLWEQSLVQELNTWPETFSHWEGLRYWKFGALKERSQAWHSGWYRLWGVVPVGLSDIESCPTEWLLMAEDSVNCFRWKQTVQKTEELIETTQLMLSRQSGQKSTPKDSSEQRHFTDAMLNLRSWETTVIVNRVLAYTFLKVCTQHWSWWHMVMMSEL